MVCPCAKTGTIRLDPSGISHTCWHILAKTEMHITLTCSWFFIHTNLKGSPGTSHSHYEICTVGIVVMITLVTKRHNLAKQFGSQYTNYCTIMFYPCMAQCVEDQRCATIYADTRWRQTSISMLNLQRKLKLAPRCRWTYKISIANVMFYKVLPYTINLESSIMYVYISLQKSVFLFTERRSLIHSPSSVDWQELTNTGTCNTKYTYKI